MIRNIESTDETARKILRTIPHVMGIVASELRQSNPMVMPAHFRLLGMLTHHSCALTQLADLQAVSAPTMSKTVSILEDRGWVTRVRSEEDRRVVMIQATEKGHQIIKESLQQAERHIATLLEPLDNDEREILSQGLDVLHRVFEASISPDQEG